MPKFLASEPGTENMYADELREELAAMDGLGHLRVRRHSDLLILESGPKHDPIAHARFRRVAVHLWRLEIAAHTGEWQPTGLRGKLDAMVAALTTEFGWTLTDIAPGPAAAPRSAAKRIPKRTSGRLY